MKQSAQNSASIRQPSQPMKPKTSPTSEMLTPSEIQSLRQQAIDDNDFFEKGFEDRAKAFRASQGM